MNQNHSADQPTTCATQWMGPLPASSGCDCHICRPGDGYDDFDRATIDTVLRHGWQVVTVSEDVACCVQGEEGHIGHEELDPGPAFAYTVGLGHRAGHPDLLMTGLDLGVMHQALNVVSERILAGLRIVPGQVLEDVLAGVPVVVEQVTPAGASEAVAWSGWFHRRPPEGLMLVWPTRSGVFDWQPGAPNTLREAQPALWREPIVHTGGVASDPPWSFPLPADQLVTSCTHVVDRGDCILWAARERDEAGGRWTVLCEDAGHESTDLRLTHLAHLVRSAPSLRELDSLPEDYQASRADIDSAWDISPWPE
ncbi:DUF4262 domain-containing protein [Nocardioides salsibiostraticola]